MLSIRALSRAIPKSSFRPFSSSLRTLSTTTRSSLLQSSWKPARLPTYYSAFSTSPIRRDPAVDSDLELAAKLKHERELEIESRNADDRPADVQSYIERSGFEVIDNPGTHDVVLTKKLENETIKIEFSINDLNMNEDMEGLEEDTAMEDEMEDYPDSESQTQKRGLGQKGGAADEAAEEIPREEDDMSAEEEVQQYPIHLTIKITKADAGVVEVAATAQDGMINVDNVYFYAKAGLSDPMSAEEMKESSGTYLGPPFSNLDSELQTLFYTYIEQRGINEDLATFLPNYVEYKEQREYVLWLENVQTFVSK